MRLTLKRCLPLLLFPLGYLLFITVLDSLVQDKRSTGSSDAFNPTEHDLTEQYQGRKRLALKTKSQSKHVAENEETAILGTGGSKLEFWPKVDSRLVKYIESNLIKANRYWADITIECPEDLNLRQHFKNEKTIAFTTNDSMDRFFNEISVCHLYPAGSAVIDEVLVDMQKVGITKAENMDGGTQIKVLLTFSNGKQAVWKPKRLPLEKEINPDIFYWRDLERHNSEIAGFHLDRLIGLRRAPPTVGRILDLSEMRDMSTDALNNTFYRSPVNNLCFYGKCDYYCDSGHPVCGNPYNVEGSLQLFLPDETFVRYRDMKSPFRRTYSRHDQLAKWQLDDSYCENNVLTKKRFATRILDIIDLAIFDFLTGNMDRHHFEFMEEFPDREAFIIHLDNGRGFGNSKDQPDILAPLYQCCLIRPSTLTTILSYYKGEPKTLAEALRDSLSRDPLAPILAIKHLIAVQRRLAIILTHVQRCLKRKTDPFHVLVPRMLNITESETDLLYTGEEEDE